MTETETLLKMALESDLSGLQVIYSSVSTNLLCVYIKSQLPASCLPVDVFQVAIHAIGDKANDLVLDIYGSVASTNGMKDRRFRVAFC